MIDASLLLITYLLNNNKNTTFCFGQQCSVFYKLIFVIAHISVTIIFYIYYATFIKELSMNLMKDKIKH